MLVAASGKKGPGVIYTPFQFNDKATLAGRDLELGIIEAAISRALEGAGTTVLLGGEAGIGKTSLVHSIEQWAEHLGMDILHGNCHDAQDPPPYGPWIDAFSSFGQEHGTERLSAAFRGTDVSTGITDQHDFQRRVRDLLFRQSSDRPLLLVLEDMHWADQATLDLLRVVARDVRRAPAAVIATYRNDELERDDALYRSLPALVREAQPTRIDLLRLDESGTRAIIDQHCSLPASDAERLARTVHARSQGNPLHTIELLLALESSGHISRTGETWTIDSDLFTDAALPVPELVRQVIESRLAGIDPSARFLLNVAAVAGETFDLDLWQAVSEMDDGAFAAAGALALRAHVLDEVPGRGELHFRHSLARETLYASIPLPERQRFHLNAARYLSERNADPDTVADHYLMARDANAVEWLTRSGHGWLRLYAPDRAITRFDRAIDIDQKSGGTAPEPYLRRGQALATLGEIEAAQADFTLAREAARNINNTPLEWEAVVSLGDLWTGRDYARAHSLYAEALDLARRSGDSSMIASSLIRSSNWYLNNNQPAAAIDHAMEAKSLYESAGDTTSALATMRILALDYLVRGDMHSSDRMFRQAIQHYRSRNDRQNLCAALTGLIYTSGTYTFHTEVPGPLTVEEYERNSGEALSIARDVQWRAGEAYVHLAMASHSGIRGNVDLAFRHALAGLEIARDIDHLEWLALGHQILGRLYLDLFALTEAEEQLRTSLHLAEQANAPLHRRLAAGYLAHVEFVRGNSDVARSYLGHTLDLTRIPETVVGRKVWASWAVIALESGDASLALTIVEALISTTLNSREDYVVPFHGRLRGEALTRLGRFDEAEQQLMLSLSSARKAGFQSVEWRVLAALASLYSAQRKSDEAMSWATSARSRANDIAARITDKELQENFIRYVQRRLPVERKRTPLQQAKRAHGGLTARQRDVATLVGRGATNAEIAAALSISERTAESHVAAILKTLGFTTRTQIAGWAVERGLTSRDPG